MKSSLIILGSIITLLLLSSTFATPVHAAAPGTGSIGDACTANSDCVTGLICNATSGSPTFQTCQNLTVGISSATTTASQINAVVTDNSGSTVSYYGCIGTTCNAQPTTNTAFWTSLGSGSAFSFGGLRPGRTYQFNVSATAHGSTATASKTGLITWPGYGFTPTDTDGGCDGATGLCKRNISWTTPFAGDSSVYYSRAVPSWTVEATPVANLSSLLSISALSNGTAIAVGSGGRGIKRTSGSSSLTGNWTDLSGLPNTLLTDVDMVDNNIAWVVGAQTAGVGNAVVTNDGGTTWTRVSNLPAESLNSVFASTNNIAWAAGADSTIVRINGTVGTTVHGPINGETLLTVFSLDGKIVLAGGVGGKVYRSTDQGATWTAATPNGASGEQLISIDSLDGQVVWLGSTSGKLWKSTDAGSTWSASPLLLGTSEVISNIHLLTNTKFWFQSSNRIGLYDEASVPKFSFDNNPSSFLGSNVSGFGVSINNRLIVVGDNLKAASHGLNNVDGSNTSIGSSAITLSSLTPATTYYYSAETTGSGVTSGTFGGSFTTPILDTIKPTVTISPLAPATRNCAVVVSGTASDMAPGTVQSVSVTLDGHPAVVATGTTSWTTTLPCAQVTAGTHTVTAISNDGTNDSLPASATFIFDTTLPTVTISAPTPVITPTITVTGTASDALDQVAKVEVLVNGVDGRINVPITVGASVNWNLPNVTLTPGLNTIVAYATDRAGNESSAAKNVTYNIPTFSISADAPTAQTVPAGTPASFSIRISAVNGFTGTVIPSATVAPAGLTPLFVPQQVSLASKPYDIVTMIVSSPTGAASEPYTITITGTSGGVTKTTSVALSLSATPDFTVSVSPASRTVVAGNAAVFDLAVSGSSTYTDPGSGITWSTTPLPAGVSASFAPMVGSPNSGGTGMVKLTLTPTAIVASGTTITVTASDGALSHTVTVGLTATPPPDFSLLIAPASAATVAGSNNPGAYNVTVQALNGFGGIVHLGLSTTPVDAAIRATFSQNDFTPTATGDVVTVNVVADTNIQCAPVPPPPGTPSPCNYALIITGTAGTLPSLITRTASATLSVTPDTAPPQITGAAASPSDRNVTISWTTNEPANSRFDLYADANHTNKIGFKETAASYCLSNCHVLSYDPVLTPLTTYYYTITSADQAFPNGNSSTVSSDANGIFKFTTQAAPDNIPPTITISSPAGGTDVIGVLTISGQASDNNPMSQVKISVTGPTGATGLPNSTVTCTTATTCPFSLTWNTMNGTSPNGSYTVTAIALSSSGPAFSATATQNFAVNNDTTPPTIECFSGQTVCEPVAVVTCASGGTCTAVVKWRTNENSTSEVEYGLAVDCAQQVRRPDGSYVSCAYTNARRFDDVNDNPNGSLPNYTDHSVTLTNLNPDQLYHYRVTSCNISNLCTN